jgi:branched-chain amino acid aminotransferase
MAKAVQKTGLREACVTAVITRGVPKPGEHDPRRWEPRLYVYATPFLWIVRPEAQERGTDAVVTRHTRRIAPDAVDPTVKNFHWGDLVRGQFEAFDRGGSVAILPDGNGLVTEGAGFNVFAMVDGCLHTPARGVLEGITRRTVIEIAMDAGIEVHAGDVRVNDLYRAAEVFITSTAGGVMPVATLDGKPVGQQAPGPVTERIRTRYWELHHDPAYTREIIYE